MNIFNWLFHKKSNRDIPPMPSWGSIVEMMRDKYLDVFADEVVDVIYSKDSSMRYVILKDKNGLFTYQLEALYQYDEDEWQYICSHDNALQYDHSVQEIANIIASVFNKQFGGHDDASVFLSVAERIKSELAK